MKETTATNTGSNKPYSESSIASGWLCPRCGRINAPWVRQCDCSPSSTVSWDKITINPCDDWWRTKITRDDDMFKIHPDTVVYTTSVNQVVGGSDYKDPVTGDQVNVPKNNTNSVKR